MSKQYKKYLSSLPTPWRSRLHTIVEKIERLDFEDLDLKKLQGSSDLFRCRVGKFRIIFRKEKDFGDVVEINTRGDIY